MIKVNDEDEGPIFPIGELTRYVPRRRGGKPLHKSTGFRWASTGVRGVRLETIRVGATLCTSARALQAFFEGLTEPRSAPASAVPPSRRRREIERGLDRAGIKP